jgi:hypothetical protein
LRILNDDIDVFLGDAETLVDPADVNVWAERGTCTSATRVDRVIALRAE